MKLTKNTFDTITDKTFDIAFQPETTLKSELIEIKSINSSTLKKGQSEPFSLVFEIPGDSIYDQNTYLIKNSEMDEFYLFLVPIGADEKGVRYEAVFT